MALSVGDARNARWLIQESLWALQTAGVESPVRRLTAGSLDYTTAIGNNYLANFLLSLYIHRASETRTFPEKSSSAGKLSSADENLPGDLIDQ